MLSKPIQQRLRRMAASLLFTAQYHSRMLYLDQRHNRRTSLHPTNELCAQDDGVTPPLPDQPLPAPLQTAQETVGGTATSSSSTLPTVKQRADHRVFMGNVPTLPISFTMPKESVSAQHTSPTLKTAIPLIAQPTPVWYTFAKRRAALRSSTTLKKTRYRKVSLLVAGLIALVLGVLVVQSSLAYYLLGTHKMTKRSRVLPVVNHTNQPILASQPAPTQQPTSTQQPTPTPQPEPFVNASQALVRLSQLDPAEYASQNEFDTWAYSTCSTAALTEVFNAYGHHYRITDVLQIESQVGAITPENGLLEHSGIARTAKEFAFNTQWSNHWTLDQVLYNANQGHPVIVDWPPDRYPAGHVVVITAGSSRYVYLADSSIWNRQRISRAQFMRWWGGFAAIVTPT